jgi:hypothetical protein
MKKYTILTLVACLFLGSTVLAGLDSKKAAYYGGSTKDKDFSGAKKRPSRACCILVMTKHSVLNTNGKIVTKYISFLTTLAVLETRSGKKIEYQDKEAEKSGRGN